MRRTPDPFKWRLSSSLRSFRLPPEEEDAGELVRLKIIFATLPFGELNARHQPPRA